MPTIPRYQSQIGLTGGPAQPKARAITSASGQEVARALSGFGRDVGAGARAIEDAARQSDIRGQRNEARDILNKAREQDRENMAGFLGKTGINANNVYGDAKKYFGDRREEILNREKLSPFQRDMIGTSYDSYSQNKLGTVLTHQERQRRATESSTLQSSMANDIEDVVAARNDEGVGFPGEVPVTEMDVGYTSLLSNFHNLADLEGWSEEVKEQKGREMDNLLFSRIAQAFINDNAVDKSKEFIDAAYREGRLNNRTKDALIKNWEVASLEQRTVDTTSEITKKDKNTWFIEADKIKDPKLKSSVKSRLTATRREAERQEVLFYKKAESDATLAIIATDNYDAAKNVVNRYASSYSNYSGTGDTVKRLNSLAKYQFGVSAGESTQRNQITELGVKDRIDLPEGHPDKITTEAQLLTALVGRTNNTGIDKVKRYLQAGGRLSPTNTENLVPLLRKIGYGEFITKKVKDSGRREVDKEKLSTISDYLQDVFADKKGDITPKMISKEVDELMSEGFIEDAGFAWFDRDLTLLDAVKEGKVDEWVPDISSEEKKKVEDILTGKGVKVTDERIIEYVKTIQYGLKKGFGQEKEITVR